MKKKYTYLIILFLMVASGVVFSRIVGNGFIYYDDNTFITENTHIQSGINRASIQWAFTTFHLSYWNPLTWLSHMLDWRLFGAYAGGHHLVGLLLHIGVAVFLFLFLYRTTRNLWASAFATAFFALHPLRVESVAWVSERKDVLSMFFAMATLYTYVSFAGNFKVSKYLLCLVLFALALMSKPMMVTLPFVLILLDYWPLGRMDLSSAFTRKTLTMIGRLLGEKIPFFILTAMISVVAFWAQRELGALANMENIPLTVRLSNAVVSYTAYLGKTFWPANLAVLYPYNFFLPLWNVTLSGMMLLGITLAVLFYIKERPFLFVGWFWYLGSLMPVIGLVQVGKQAMADRYTYFPSIGIVIILVWGTRLLFPRADIQKKILLPVGIAVLAILSVLTWQQCSYWKNSIVLFSHALQVTKNNYDTYCDRGYAYDKLGYYQLAIADYNEAIRLKPQYARAYYSRAMTYSNHGHYQLAVEDYNETIRLKPNDGEAYNNRGGAYFQQGKNKLGCGDVQKACELGSCIGLKWAQKNGYCR